MKKTLILLITLLSINIASFAQSHWTFAKTFGGFPVDINNLPNNIPEFMEIDSHGNVYIFGTYGTTMIIDGESFPGGDTGKGQFLAKFDCYGDLLWKTAVKSVGVGQYPQWMQLKNDTVYIMGQYYVNDPQTLYFLDTVIHTNQLTYPYEFPWDPSNMTNYFAKISPDGEVLEVDHINVFGWKQLASGDKKAPFYVNDLGEKYFTGMIWLGPDETDTLISVQYNNETILDSLQTNYSWNPVFMKVSNEDELLWQRVLVDSSSNNSVSGMIIEINDMTVDEEENFYYVGEIRVGMQTPGSVPKNCDLYLLDGHTMHFTAHGGDLGFAFKLNSEGECLWFKSMSRATDTIINGLSEFTSIDINETTNEIYIAGRGHAQNYLYPESYSIFPDGEIFISPCYEGFWTYQNGYILSLNCSDGTINWKDCPYSTAGGYFGNLDYTNDSIYLGYRWADQFHFGDSIYTHDGTKYSTLGFSHVTYNTSGEMTSVRNIETMNGSDTWAYDTKVDAAGNIYFTGRQDADLNFHDTSTNASYDAMFLARYGEECPVFVDTNAYICFGETFVMGEESFSESGAYQFVIENETGADTIVNLSLFNYAELQTGLPADTIICIDNILELQANLGFDSYYWSDESIGSNAQFSYDEAGTYTEYLIIGLEQSIGENTAYCEHTDSIQIQVDICDGLPEERALNFTVYPNPAKNKLTVDVNTFENCTLELLDSFGRQCKKINIESTSTVIDLNNLAEGVYMLRLSNNNVTKTKRVIKQ